VAWGYQFALGALLHHLTDTRVERLSGGEDHAADPGAGTLLRNFIVAGLRGALPRPRATSSSSIPTKSKTRRQAS